MAGRLPKCVDAFILAILCGNPILKGAWITLLNSIVFSLQAQIAIVTANLVALNSVSRVYGIASSTIKTLIDRTKVDLNLFLGPIQQFSSCAPILDINKQLQRLSNNKVTSALKKMDYKIRRVIGLLAIYSAVKEYLDEQVEIVQDFIDRINDICP